ncbi:MAG: phage DNA polymerase-associated SH3 family protein [Shewanella sp.]
MIDVSVLETGQLVNITFDTPLMGPANNVVVQAAKVGYDMARRYSDIIAIQKNIYSSLSSAPDDNVNRYNYLVYADQKGRLHAVADAWIRKVDVVEGLKVIFKVHVPNLNEIDHIKLALASRGIDNVEYEIV